MKISQNENLEKCYSEEHLARENNYILFLVYMIAYRFLSCIIVHSSVCTRAITARNHRFLF